MQIENKRIAELIPANYNPRKDLQPGDAEYDKLKRSIEEFGYVEPIIYNKQTGNVVGGHQRLKVLTDLGYVEADCVVVDLDENGEKALNLALNKISGDWDEEKLAALLKELSDIDFDIALTGFNSEETNALVDEYIAFPSDDEFNAAEEYEKITEPFTMPGDFWHLGSHRLYCGDSCNSEDVNVLMNGEKASLILTDPPYNVDYEGQAGTIKNDNMADSRFYEFLLSAFSNMLDTAADGAAIYIFHADSQGVNFRTAMTDAGFLLKQCLVWVKNHFTIGRQDYQWRHEPILYGWKPGAAHYFTDDRSQNTVFDYSGTPDFKTMKKDELVKYIEEFINNINSVPQSIIYHNKPNLSIEHPTMKPVSLVCRFIKNSSRLNAVVQDLFGGSGSTLIACEEMGRQARLMELDERFTDVIIKRYIEHCKNNNKHPEIKLIRNRQPTPVDLSIFS